MTAAAAFIIEEGLEQPSSSVGVLELPCGLYVPVKDEEEPTIITECEVREITGDQEDMLASKKVPSFRKMGQLVAGCVTRLGQVTEPGILSTLIPRLPVGDRVFLLLRIRQITLGDMLPYAATCPHCDKEALYKVDLNTVVVKNMADRTKRVFKDTLPSGHEVTFHVMLGSDEEKVYASARESDKVSMMILARLDLLNGKPPNLSMIKALGMRDRNHLRDRFDEVEGGVETDVQFACTHCGEEFEEDLDISQQGFFFPSAMLRKWKRKSSI